MAKQIFFDDFTSFDASKWSPAWGKFDPDKGTQMRFTDENIAVIGGDLKLKGTVATGTDAEKAPFLSAMVNTRKPDKGEILFQAKGQFIVSVRAKLPAGKASWPGIWMTGTKGDWPACGEIDILEAKGWMPHDYQMNTHTPRAVDSTSSQQHEKALSKTGSSLLPLYNNVIDYWTYSVAKLDDHIDFYLYDKLVHTVNYSEMDVPDPFTDPENGWIIRLSHIIGGSFLEYEGNREYVDATKHKDSYPSSMDIDYVRVISLDEPGTVDKVWDKLDIVSKYANLTPKPPVVVPPSPMPDPAPAPDSAPQPKAKNDWVREDDCLVFFMM